MSPDLFRFDADGNRLERFLGLTSNSFGLISVRTHELISDLCRLWCLMPEQSEGHNHTCKINFHLLAGHKVDFIFPCGENKSIFWPPSRKKIVCDTGKTFILLAWLLPSQTSHSQYKFFFPSCTIYYFLLAGHKVDFISPCGKQIHFLTL